MRRAATFALAMAAIALLMCTALAVDFKAFRRATMKQKTLTQDVADSPSELCYWSMQWLDRNEKGCVRGTDSAEECCKKADVATTDEDRRCALLTANTVSWADFFTGGNTNSLQQKRWAAAYKDTNVKFWIEKMDWLRFHYCIEKMPSRFPARPKVAAVAANVANQAAPPAPPVEVDTPAKKADRGELVELCYMSMEKIEKADGCLAGDSATACCRKAVMVGDRLPRAARCDILDQQAISWASFNEDAEGKKWKDIHHNTPNKQLEFTAKMDYLRAGYCAPKMSSFTVSHKVLDFDLETCKETMGQLLEAAACKDGNGDVVSCCRNVVLVGDRAAHADRCDVLEGLDLTVAEMYKTTYTAASLLEKYRAAKKDDVSDDVKKDFAAREATVDTFCQSKLEAKIPCPCGCVNTKGGIIFHLENQCEAGKWTTVAEPCLADLAVDQARKEWKWYAHAKRDEQHGGKPIAQRAEWNKFRAHYVDSALQTAAKAVCKPGAAAWKDVCAAKTGGSTTCGSDIDVSMEGSNADLLMAEINKVMETNFATTSDKVMDVNFYSMSWRYEWSKSECVAGKGEMFSLTIANKDQELLSYRFSLGKLIMYLRDAVVGFGLNDIMKENPLGVLTTLEYGAPPASDGKVLPAAERYLKMFQNKLTYYLSDKTTPEFDKHFVEAYDAVTTYMAGVCPDAYGPTSALVQELKDNHHWDAALCRSCRTKTTAPKYDHEDSSHRNRNHECWANVVYSALRAGVKKAHCEAVQHASYLAGAYSLESYFTWGPLADIVVNVQKKAMARPGDNAVVALKKPEHLDALTEHLADAAKEVAHAYHGGGNGDHAPDMVDLMLDMSKYIFRAGASALKLFNPVSDDHITAFVKTSPEPVAIAANIKKDHNYRLPCLVYRNYQIYKVLRGKVPPPTADQLAEAFMTVVECVDPDQLDWWTENKNKPGAHAMLSSFLVEAIADGFYEVMAKAYCLAYHPGEDDCMNDGKARNKNSFSSADVNWKPLTCPVDLAVLCGAPKAQAKAQ